MSNIFKRFIERIKWSVSKGNATIEEANAVKEMWYDKLPELEVDLAYFNKLLEYSLTNPTGVTIGKRWKRNLTAGETDAAPIWIICEYVSQAGSKTHADIKHYKPKIK